MPLLCLFRSVDKLSYIISAELSLKLLMLWHSRLNLVDEDEVRIDVTSRIRRWGPSENVTWGPGLVWRGPGCLLWLPAPGPGAWGDGGAGGAPPLAPDSQLRHRGHRNHHSGTSAAEPGTRYTHQDYQNSHITYFSRQKHANGPTILVISKSWVHFQDDHNTLIKQQASYVFLNLFHQTQIILASWILIIRE